MLTRQDIIKEYSMLKIRLERLFRDKYNVPEDFWIDFNQEWNRCTSAFLYREEDLRDIKEI